MSNHLRGRDLEDEARHVVERLGGRWTKQGGMCRCPAHGDRSPSLSVRLGRSRLLLHCFAGCSASEILQALISARLLGAGHAVESTGRAVPREDRSSEIPLRLWGASHPLGGSPGERYLKARGIASISPELRYHPRTPHRPAPFTVFRPALIAAVRDATGVVAIHRTFLDPGASRIARLRADKCALGSLGTGAVRLDPAGTRLGLAEGIETALSASALFGVPCWATLGTERFGRVQLPDDVSELLLFLDNDAGGVRAEMLARKAFAHRVRLHAHHPARCGADWNDVLMARLARRSKCARGGGEPTT